ncbi:MAG TPA: diaminopimelate decarboxylase [Actinomycetota bacterium]|nr:diaminopimelate decarboxylase [Actinomycetota bacterium]
MERTASRLTWWERPGLEVRDGRLTIAGRDAESIAREHGTPLYVYDLVRVEEQVRALQRALGSAGLRHRVRLALKAQREPVFLAFLRGLGGPGSEQSVGMDVCSPGELRWALDHGWDPSEISYTGTNLSERDLDEILGAGVHLNVDLLTQLERVGRRAPGSTIGIRINPRIGAAFPGGGQTYAGDRPTKFGIYPERLEDALAIARRHDLMIDTVHVHAGYLYLTDALPVVDETMRRVAAATRTLMDAGCPIVEVNTGGGLGVPFRPGDLPLDVEAWANVLATHLGPLDVTVGTEPGEFLAKECAVHLTEAVSVEDRDGTTFVGLDTGWNVINEHFVYRIPFHPILCRAADAEPSANVTVAGHINEGNDLFAEDHPMPAVEEGDIVAIPLVGSYNASMVSVHCLRPEPRAVSFTDRG